MALAEWRHLVKEGLFRRIAPSGTGRSVPERPEVEADIEIGYLELLLGKSLAKGSIGREVSRQCRPPAGAKDGSRNIMSAGEGSKKEPRLTLSMLLLRQRRERQIGPSPTWIGHPTPDEQT